MRIFLLLFLLVFSCWNGPLWGQSRSQLESKRKQLNKQIKNASYLLNKTATSRKNTVQELKTLENQIESRTELIEVIRKELQKIESLRSEKKAAVKELGSDLELLRSSYRKVLIELYHYKSKDQTVLFFLSTESFSKAHQRQLYLSKLEKRRSEQAKLIKSKQKKLTEEILDLEKQQKDKETLLEEELTQKSALDKELNEKDDIVKDLKSKESKLRADLKRKAAAKSQLNRKIEQLIRNQIAAAKSATRSYPGKDNNKTYIPPTSGGAATQVAFEKLKGRLPQPVSGGVIVGKYGKQQHPIFDQVYTYNNGIDIRCTPNASVKAVHSGVVVSVFSIPGNGNAVLLKHGNYYTTYSNLHSVAVKRGQKVKTGTYLGKVGKDANAGTYLLHFELWSGKNKVNPQHWLR